MLGNSLVTDHKIKQPNEQSYVRTIEPKTTEPEEQAELEILFFGDTMLGRYIATLRSRYAEEDPTFPLTHFPEIVATYTDNPDVVAVNLEGPITDFQTSYCDLCFRFLPETAQLLAEQGVTFTNLANNHMFNQGQTGYEQTQTYISSAGLNYVGNPKGIDDFYSYIQEIDGYKIGWLGFNEIEATLDYEAATALTKEIAEQTDFTIVAIHWGTEYVNTPSSSIQQHAHDFVSAGADMIWGTHPHAIQSIENYGDGMIFYSLGNLVFDQYWSAGTQEGLGVYLKFTDPSDPIYELIPLKLTTNKGDPYLMDESAKKDMLTRLEKYSTTIGVVADDRMNFEEGILQPW